MRHYMTEYTWRREERTRIVVAALRKIVLRLKMSQLKSLVSFFLGNKIPAYMRLQKGTYTETNEIRKIQFCFHYSK